MVSLEELTQIQLIQKNKELTNNNNLLRTQLVGYRNALRKSELDKRLIKINNRKAIKILENVK